MIQRRTGIYKVINPRGVNVRKEPKIVETALGSNRLGFYKLGTMIKIDSFTVDLNLNEWGKVTAAESSGIAGWVIVKDINREFVELVQPDHTSGDILEDRIANLEARVFALENRK